MGTNSLLKFLLAWYIRAIIRRSAVSTRPNPDKTAATSPAETLPEGYRRLHSRFGWQVPAQFNIAQVCSQRWAERPDAAQRVAIRAYADGALKASWTYAQL